MGDNVVINGFCLVEIFSMLMNSIMDLMIVFYHYIFLGTIINAKIKSLNQMVRWLEYKYGEEILFKMVIKEY